MNVICFDNENKSYDRYTFIEMTSGVIFGASEHPFSPLGFGQFRGQTSDFKMTPDEYISYARKSGNLGKEVSLTSLPAGLQKFIRVRLGEESYEADSADKNSRVVMPQ